MKIIWHIIWKDIRRDLRALLLWALLFLGQLVVGVVARNPGEMGQDYFIQLQLGSMGLVWLQVIMGYILVARWVQADVLIGTTAFWSTRPVSAARLLVAKGIGALLAFGLLPVLLLLPWWLYCGFGVRDVAWGAIDVFGWQLLMIAPAFLVASLTDDLGRVLLWTLLLLIGLISWIVLLQSSLGSFGFAAGRNEVTGGVMYTRLWLSAVVFVAGAVVVATHQYLTRRFVRSVLGVVACLGLVAATGLGCLMDLSGAIATWDESAVEPTPGLVDRLSIQVEPAAGWRVPNPPKGRIAKEDARLRVLLRVHGLPDGLNLGVKSSEHTWTWPDGIKLRRDGWFTEIQVGKSQFLRRSLALPVPEADPETEQWRRDAQKKIAERQLARGYVNEWQARMPVDRFGLLVIQHNIPNSIFAKMQAEPPAYRVDLQCLVFRSELLAEVPLRHGARASGGSDTFHFRQLGKAEEGLISTQPALTQSGLWFSAGISDHYRGLRQRRSILVVNRVTGDIEEEWGQWRRGTLQMMIAGVAVSWSKYALKAPIVIRDGQEVSKDPQWREHSILAVVVDREAGRFEREVSTNRFELNSPSKVPSGEGALERLGQPALQVGVGRDLGKHLVVGSEE